MSLAVPLIIIFENHELFTPGLTLGFPKNIKNTLGTVLFTFTIGNWWTKES